MDRRAFLIAALVAAGVVLLLWLRDHPPGQQAPDVPPASRTGDDEAGSSGRGGEPRPADGDAGVHLALGNPSRATADPGEKDNFLLAKRYYALSYNSAKGTPNWVSWCLRKDALGTASRSQFYPDPDLPRGFRHVTPADYTGSGFDRGRLCPRSDRKSTPEELLHRP